MVFAFETYKNISIENMNKIIYLLKENDTN